MARDLAMTGLVIHGSMKVVQEMLDRKRIDRRSNDFVGVGPAMLDRGMTDLVIHGFMKAVQEMLGRVMKGLEIKGFERNDQETFEPVISDREMIGLGIAVTEEETGDLVVSDR